MSRRRDRSLIAEILLCCAGICAVLFMGGGWTMVIVLAVFAVAAVVATRILRSGAGDAQSRRPTSRNR